MITPESRARLAVLVERRVTPAELREALETPLSREEREETLALRRWFTRRYATPLERLAYVRQTYQRWTRRAVGSRDRNGTPQD